jgi:hypothetical protein
VRSPLTNKDKIYVNMCPQTLSLRGTTPKFTLAQSFRLLSVETSKNRGVFSFNSKWRNTSPMQFWFISNNSQSLRELWKVQHSMIRRVHACIDLDEKFLLSAVNWDLISNKNSRVIKLETCIVNVLLPFYLKYYIDKASIFECNLSIGLNDSFRDI